jgi:protein ImuA
MLPVSPGPDTEPLASSLQSPLQNTDVGGHEPLPRAVEAALWRGSELGGPISSVLGTGFGALDRVLPGGGWPCGALTEILMPQFSVVEMRLTAHVLREQTGQGRRVALVGPPHAPHAPGLRLGGVDERFLDWIEVDAPRDRQWAAEQVIKAGTFGAVIAWLPHIRAEQIRRLQVLAARCKGPAFLCRPEHAAREASAAPLRLLARPHTDWQIRVQVLKRKGTPLDTPLLLPSVPGGIQNIMTDRLRYPSRLKPVETRTAVVRAAAAPHHQRPEVAAETSES